MVKFVERMDKRVKANTDLHDASNGITTVVQEVAAPRPLLYDYLGLD